EPSHGSSLISTVQISNVALSVRIRADLWLAFSKQPNCFRLLNRGHFSQFRQHLGRNMPVHVDHLNRFPRSTGLHVPYPAAKREVRDIDLVLAQNRAYLPDHAGDVAVAHVNEAALERSFYINAIHV